MKGGTATRGDSQLGLKYVGKEEDISSCCELLGGGDNRGDDMH